MAFTALQEIMDLCEKENRDFWEIILADDVMERKVTKEASLEKMRVTWQAMLAATASYDKKLTSVNGLSGGDGGRMEAYLSEKKEESLCAGFLGEVISQALKMAESNACMKRIVAAPTAGSSGVLPAVLVPYYHKKKASEETMIKALYTAAGIGQVIAYRASISGAAGGCQAEVGTAGAMAAGALVHLQGGSCKEIMHAAAMALKNLLGLVCDPVAGLVEVPCIKRNVIGAVNALSCAEMAMAGIVSRIPPDEVIDAMKEVGDRMDSSLKETGLGGLAATPTGMAVKNSHFL